MQTTGDKKKEILILIFTKAWHMYYLNLFILMIFIHALFDLQMRENPSKDKKWKQRKQGGNAGEVPGIIRTVLTKQSVKLLIWVSVWLNACFPSQVLIAKSLPLDLHLM